MEEIWKEYFSLEETLDVQFSSNIYTSLTHYYPGIVLGRHISVA